MSKTKLVKSAKSRKGKAVWIQLDATTYIAKELHLDKRSKFFRKRVKSLLEAGYAKGKQDKYSLTLTKK